MQEDSFMIKNIIKNAILIFSSLIFAIFLPNFAGKCYAAKTADFDVSGVKAKAVYLIDANSETVIVAKNETQKLPIASMTKLATLSIIFSELEKGSLSESDIICVSQNAASTEGSSAFLDAGSKYRVDDLIKTIVMVSANDSCVALAEHISGSEQLFAKRMNQLVKQLNLQNTNFENSTGLPSANHYSCASDMAKIYKTICNNTLYKKFSKIWMEDFMHPSGRITGLVNTNRLIKTYDGCTGGKTGHTEEAKYCLTASATRNGTTLISVIIGAENSKSRFEQTKDLFNFAFANFESKQIVDDSIALAQVEVVGANIKSLPAYAKNGYTKFDKKGETGALKYHVMVNENIKAPLASGDVVGKVLVLDQNNIIMKEIDLIVKDNVEQIKYKQILENLFKAW